MLPNLSPGEKAQLLQWITHDLGRATPGIEKTPGVCGGACAHRPYANTLWLLEQARRLGTTEVEILRCYRTLRAENLANAWTMSD